MLEVGCGTGYMITMPLLVAGYRVEGIDLDRESIDYGRVIAAGAGLDPGALSDRNLETINESFDVVILSEVLEHQTDRGVDHLLHLVFEHLRPGGKVLVTVPNGYGWFELESFVWYRLRVGRFLEITRLNLVLHYLKARV